MISILLAPPASTVATELDGLLAGLWSALEKGCSPATCHRRWSRFVRERDANRCLLCGTSGRLAAHHVFRKSVLPEARYQTGNGAALCRSCHAEVHVGYNGRADLSLPFDEQGGEKLETVARLYRLLAAQARERHAERTDDYYHLSDQVLAKFMMMQGFEPEPPATGSAIHLAWRIWDCAPRNVMEALIRANMPDANARDRDGRKRRAR